MLHAYRSSVNEEGDRPGCANTLGGHQTADYPCKPGHVPRLVHEAAAG